MNAALQVARAQSAPEGVAFVRGYGVLTHSGGMAAASANINGTTRRNASATTVADPRGEVAEVTTVVRAQRGDNGASAVGLVRARQISVFGGRVRIASIEVRVRGRADDGAAASAMDHLQVGEVLVDGTPTPVGPGTVVSVPGAGEVGFGESTTAEDGTTAVDAVRVSAAAGEGPPLVIGHIDVRVVAGAGLSQAPTAPPAVDPDLPRAGAPITAEPGSAAPADRPGAQPQPQPLPSSPVTPPITVAPASPVAPSAPAAPPAAPVRPTPHLLPGTPPTTTPVTSGVQGNVFPVVGTFAYSDDYGAPRAGTGWHHGTDVFAPTATPVVAVADGRLSKVGWNTLGGNRLWLTDAGGTAYYYAHLSAYSSTAVEGGVVRAGEVIGYVGNTGQAATTPPHLHFEIHPGGEAAPSVNPFAFLSAWESRAGLTTAAGGAALTPQPDAAAGAVVVGVEVERDAAPLGGDGTARPVR